MLEPDGVLDENGQLTWKCKHCGEDIFENDGPTNSYTHRKEPFIDRIWCWKKGCEGYFAEPEGAECSFWCRGGKPEDEKDYWDKFYEEDWGWIQGTISSDG